MKIFGNTLIIMGIVFLVVFGYQFISHKNAQQQTMVEAEEQIEEGMNDSVAEDIQKQTTEQFDAEHNEAFATLEIPKLDKTLPVVEGTDPDTLEKGVGHLSQSVFPGQNEQIVLSGHRDTVFRKFEELELGDTFIVNMPYDTFTYKIKETEIVPEDDTSVIRKMGEEVLVVTTCYPFHYIGGAPKRFVAYAYPVE